MYMGRVGSDDPFARRRRKLQAAVGDRASFQAALGFARTGNNE
jgi:hypothetical protein